jgi:hypothetical protein
LARKLFVALTLVGSIVLTLLFLNLISTVPTQAQGPAVDFAVTEFSADRGPDLEKGEPVHFTVTVMNAGTDSNLSTVPCAIFVDDALYWVWKIDQNGADPGQPVRMWFDVVFFDDGVHTVYVMADYGDLNGETNEDNNQSPTLSFDVSDGCPRCTEPSLSGTGALDGYTWGFFEGRVVPTTAEVRVYSTDTSLLADWQYTADATSYYLIENLVAGNYRVWGEGCWVDGDWPGNGYATIYRDYEDKAVTEGSTTRANLVVIAYDYDTPLVRPDAPLISETHGIANGQWTSVTMPIFQITQQNTSFAYPLWSWSGPNTCTPFPSVENHGDLVDVGGFYNLQISGVYTFSAASRQFRLIGDAANFTYKLDLSPPSAPASVSIGSLQSGEWTNTTYLSGTWTASSDLHAGVSHYLVCLGDAACGPDQVVISPTTVYTWSAGDVAADGTYFLRVRAVDAAGNASDVSSFIYRLDRGSPTITRTSDSPVATTGAVTLTWTVGDSLSDLVSHQVVYTHTTTGMTGTQVLSGTARQWLHLFDTPGTYQVAITSQDEAGNTSPPAVWQVTVPSPLYLPLIFKDD